MLGVFYSVGSKLKSIFNQTCPRCQQSPMFLERNMYKLRNLSRMHKRCAHCDLNFDPETGYYWGAMMISHALTTGLSVIVHFIAFQFWGWNVWPFIIIFCLSLALIIPVTFRMARMIWINIFIDFDETL